MVALEVAFCFDAAAGVNGAATSLLLRQATGKILYASLASFLNIYR